MASRRRVPDSGINLFQLIYVLIGDYARRTGLSPLNLSLGNPDTVPVEALRRLQARYALDEGHAYHTYAEDKSLRGFCEAMILLHGGLRLEEHPHLRGVPIPGIKTASALLPLACGLHLPERRRRDRFVLASNLPAYDVIGTWGEAYLGARRVVWPLLAADGMRLSLARLEGALKARKLKRADLIFVIRPGNPASVGASREEWEALIGHCLERGTRLVNDAAYVAVAGDGHVPLARVAKDYPDLEWLELYSVSKSFSDPGARLGALVGSREFVEDFVMVKGNTESGPVPSVMAAYGDFLSDAEAARRALLELRALYRRRLDYVIPRFKAAGLREACGAKDGFFTLWKVPRRAFGLELKGRRAGPAPHEAFNRLAIDKAGLVGVHFQGPGPRPEPLIRYAVCSDVLDPVFQTRFESALEAMKPEYDAS